MTIQERQLMISEFSKNVLRAIRNMERLGYKDTDIENIIDVVVKDFLKKFK